MTDSAALRAAPRQAMHHQEAAPSFEEQLGRLMETGYRVALGMLLNASDAEDAVQEAALRAWRRQGNVRRDSDLRPWFLGIVANR